MLESRLEKPSAFKHWISPQVVETIAESLAGIEPRFDRVRFLSLTRELAKLELRDRVRLIAAALRQTLPSRYAQALKAIMVSAQEGRLKGFALWPYSQFIESFGGEDLDLSLNALYKLTPLFTSEFAVRPLLATRPEETLAVLERWASDRDMHVRRWVSEGTRPRLPWGQRLDVFIANPGHTLTLLEKLKHDDELYVRKSVANHLNDISKDHPRLVIKTLKRWRREAQGSDRAKIEWITAHALRTLIKKGTPEALALVGVSPDAKIQMGPVKLAPKRARVGEELKFSFTLESRADRAQRLVVDYVVHHRRARGETSEKVFKLKTFLLPARGRLVITKRHSLKPVTTRRLYPGAHLLEIQINGRRLAKVAWRLV